MWQKNWTWKKFKKVLLDTDHVLKIWWLRNPTFEGKIIIFKTLALSKKVFFAQMLSIPKEIIDNIQRIQEDFLWNSSAVKINL